MNTIRRLRSAVGGNASSVSPKSRKKSQGGDSKSKSTVVSTASEAAEKRTNKRGKRSKAALARRRAKARQKNQRRKEDKRAEGARAQKSSRPQQKKQPKVLTIGGRPTRPSELSSLLGFRVGLGPMPSSLAACLYSAAVRTLLRRLPPSSVLGVGVHPSWATMDIIQPLTAVAWACGKDLGEAVRNCGCGELMCTSLGDANVIVGPGFEGGLSQLVTKRTSRLFLIAVRPGNGVSCSATKSTLGKRNLVSVQGESSLLIWQPPNIKNGTIRLKMPAGYTTFRVSSIDVGCMTIHEVHVSGNGVPSGRIPGNVSGLLSDLLPSLQSWDDVIDESELPAGLPDFVENSVVGLTPGIVTQRLQERKAVRLVQEQCGQDNAAAEKARAAIEIAKRRGLWRKFRWLPYQMATEMIAQVLGLTPRLLQAGIAGTLVGFLTGTRLGRWLLLKAWRAVKTYLDLLPWFWFADKAGGVISFGEGAIMGSLTAQFCGDRDAALVDVLVEETLKHKLGPPATLAICLVEAWHHRTTRYIPTACMHVAAAALDLPQAVLLHYVWNIHAIGNGLLTGKLSDTAWAVSSSVDNHVEIVPACSDQSGDPYEALSLTAVILREDDPVAGVSCKGEIPVACDVRTACWRIGPTLLGATPLVHGSCVHNDRMAVATRVCSGKAPWDRDMEAHKRVWRGVIRWGKLCSENLLPELVPSVAPPETAEAFEEWLLEYPANYREVLRRAREQYQQEGLQPKDLRFKSFVKLEKLPLMLYEADAKLRKPRLIQGRTDKVKVLTGPWFRWAGKVLAESWNRESRIFYASGVSSEDLGQWASECESDALIPHCFDFSAWDSTVGPGPICAWMAACDDLGWPSDIRAVVERRLSPLHGRTKFGIVYRKLAQVSSGDGDTSVGNSYIQGLGWAWVLSHLANGLGNECRIMVLGDDSVIAAPERLPEVEIRQLWHKLGFVLTGGVATWNTATFCSGRFWATEGTRVFGPSPGRVLAKTFWSLINWGPKKRTAWLRGVCIGLKKSANHVPIVGVLVRQLLALLGPGRVIDDTRYSRRVKFAAEHELPGRSGAALMQLSEITGLHVGALLAMEMEAASIYDVLHVFDGGDWEVLVNSAP